MSEPTEEGIQEVLRSAYSREQSHGREPVYQRTPLDEILQKENGSGELSVQEYTPAFLMMMGYFFSEGPHPGTVMRRVFAFAKALCPDLMLNMSLHEVGLMFGETKAAAGWRIKQLINRPAQASGVHGHTLPWQKSASTVAKYASAARGNTNRRGSKKNPKNPK